MIRVVRLTEAYQNAWEAYLAQSPGATIYHSLGWKHAVEKTYGVKTIYLLAFDDANEVVGLLPLVYQRFVPLTTALISLPYGPYGGVLSDRREVAQALVDEADSVRREMGAGCLLLKSLERLDCSTLTHAATQYSMTLDISAGFDGVFNEYFTKSCRRHCRKASRLGTEVQLGNDDRLMRDHYKLYSRQQHSFGTPTHSIEWFRNLKTFLSGHFLYAVSYLDGEAASVKCALQYGNRLITCYSGRRRSLSAVGASNLVNAELIRHACSSGYTVVDFARAAIGSGVYYFKKSFGAVPTPTYQQYAIAPGARVPLMSPDDPVARLPVRVWRRLPRFVVNALGPSIRKSLAT